MRSHIAILLLFTGAAPATAQHAPDSLVQARLAAEIARAERVRVFQRGDTTILARPRLMTGARPALRDSLRADVPLARLDSIQIPIHRPGEYAARGAVLGFLGGALVGGLVGAMIHASLCDRPDTFFNCDGGNVVRGALVIGAGGAVYGALLGLAKGLGTHWKTVWPRHGARAEPPRTRIP